MRLSTTHNLINNKESSKESTNKTCEYHIASFVGQAPPPLISSLTQFINSFSGCEVHGSNENGKIVFTVEASSHKTIAQTIDEIHLTDQFLSISPVYHQFLTESPTTDISEVN